MNTQKTQDSQTNPEQQQPDDDVTIPGFELYYNAIVRTAWYWDENRNTG